MTAPAPRIVRLVAGEHAERLDSFLARSLDGCSRAAAQRLIDGGGVAVDGRPGRASQRLSPGTTVSVTLTPSEPSHLLPEQRALSVLYEDADLLAVDKPPGIAVHPGAGRRNGTLANALLGRWSELSTVGGAERPGIVHRLDLDTSGVLLVAKTDAAHAALARQFAQRTVAKAYLALLSTPPQPADGIIDAPIGRDLHDRQRMAVRDGGRPARTRYHTLGVWGGRALVVAMPETGRTHQLRVHFAAIGCALCGDATYGGGPGPAGRMWLHAWRLRFRRPSDGEAMQVEAPIPPDLTTGLPDLDLLLRRGRDWSGDRAE